MAKKRTRRSRKPQNIPKDNPPGSAQNAQESPKVHASRKPRTVLWYKHWLIWLAVILLVVASLSVAWVSGVFGRDPYPGIDRGKFALGPTYACRRPANFLSQIGPDSENQAEQNARVYVGVILRTNDGQVYQRPGWQGNCI